MKQVLVLLLLLCPFSLGNFAIGNELIPLQDEINELKKGQAIILNEIQGIKKLLQRPGPQKTAFKEAVFTIGDDPLKGDKNAVITMVEIFDFE